AAQQQPAFELEPGVEASQRLVVPVEAPAPGVGLGVQAEAQNFEADHAENGGEDRGHARGRAATKTDQAEQDREMYQESEREQDGAGNEEELIRRVEQHHPEAAP